MRSNEYTCTEVANMTNKTPRTVREWIKKGLLKANRPSGRDYVITREDFNRFWYGDKSSGQTHPT